jgi:hypothetical protein
VTLRRLDLAAEIYHSATAPIKPGGGMDTAAQFANAFFACYTEARQHHGDQWQHNWANTLLWSEFMLSRSV